LAMLIAPPLIRSRNRNTPLLGVLVLLWISDFTFMLAMRTADVAMASGSLLATLNVVLLLITIIGGRIVPSFTGNALRKAGILAAMRSWPWLENTVIVLMVVMLLVDLWGPGVRLAGAVAGLAGSLQLLRLSGWQGWRTGKEPIVWVLHAGYAWIPLGLLLKAGFLMGGFSWAAFWMHALGAGAAATMILAVMSRASLGHSGRPLVVAPIMAWSYGLLILAVLVRVFGASLLPFSYTVTIQLAGGLWIIAWLIYAVVYTPILLLPRADGKPG
ncbi:MAG TPA: NnrS family protein, partial [Xanthomonadales bacterium]|nr:NnrS family protein [Xanthomonadales bacterium]